MTVLAAAAGRFPRPIRPHSSARPASARTSRPPSQNVAPFRTALLCLIDQRRAQQGLGALYGDAQLLAAAQHHADDMVAGDYFGHTSPDGETLRQRAFDSGYATSGRHYGVGEDLAWGTYDPTDRDRSAVTPSGILSNWMRSPTHRAIIATREFRDAAVGVALAAPASLAGGQPGVTVAVELGVRRSPTQRQGARAGRPGSWRQRCLEQRRCCARARSRPPR